MSAQSDVQAHASAMLATMATAVSAAITKEPLKFCRDELGKKLTYLLMDEARNAAAAENFANLDQG